MSDVYIGRTLIFSLSGVPQGSVLGPILFICYINDMPDSIASFIYMYADDAKLFTASRDQARLQRSGYAWWMVTDMAA